MWEKNNYKSFFVYQEILKNIKQDTEKKKHPIPIRETTQVLNRRVAFKSRLLFLNILSLNYHDTSVGTSIIVNKTLYS